MAFLTVCQHFDSLVERSEISRDAAQVALILLKFSDKSFYRAFKAFTNWAVPRFRQDFTTNSETADAYLRCMVSPYLAVTMQLD